MEQSRWKSPVLWTATVANIALIVGLLLPQVDVSVYVRVAGIVVGMLVQFGILNNPTNKTGI